jgi:hypothetical protein
MYKFQKLCFGNEPFKCKRIWNSLFSCSYNSVALLSVKSILVLAFTVALTSCLFALTAAADNPNDVANLDSVKSVINRSLNEKNQIVTIRNRIGVFTVRSENNNGTSSNFLFSRLPIEFGMFGPLANLIVTSEKKYSFSDDSSEIVIFGDYSEHQINELNKKLPGAKQAITKEANNLRSNGCYFFSASSNRHADDIQTAYIFVGSKTPPVEASICIHDAFLKALGVEVRTSNAKRDFLTELIAVHFINACSTQHGADRLACVDRKIKEFKE